MSEIEIGILKPRKLDPVEDAPSYQSVEELDIVLQNAKEKNIRNIGLTGPYGSGKSSVLRTLMEDKGCGRNFLSISLATLRSDDDLKRNTQNSKEQNSEENKDTKRSEEDEEHRALLNRKIEYSILQQLIYRERSSTVPGSRFKRIVHLTPKELRKFAIYSILFIVAFAIAFEPSFARVETLYGFLNFGNVLNSIFDVLALGYMGVCVFYCIRYLLQAYSNSKLNKLNVKDGEIGLKEEETSIFNKHLDEIIYFFRATNKYETVIIEDLDRFNTPDIYLKLRELNQILNDSEEIKQHIVFIYAVKDDVFQDSERTKFFDYLVTVIPVINPSNSPDKLKEELSKVGLEGKISDIALSEIGFFIQDMRILKNIVHELEEYRSKLLDANNQNLDLTKLLAMMVYKNYHPRDFSELHQRKGKVYEALCLKEQFIATALETLKDEEAQIEKDEKHIAQNRGFSEEELRFLFLNVILKKCQASVYAIEINNTKRGITEICANKDLFNVFLTLNGFRYYRTYSGGSTTWENFGENVSEIFNSSGFARRIQLLSADEIKNLRNRRDLIEIKKRNLSSLSFSQLLIKFESVRNHKDYKALKLPELIDVFLKSGYLDEDYYDFISYFYPGMLSPTDREYLLAIKRLENPVYDQKIDKIDNFIKKLTPRNFDTDSILNVQLVDYILCNRHNPEIKVWEDYLLARIDREDAPYDFWQAFYLKSQNPKKLFSNIIPKHKERTWIDIDGLDESIKGILKECFLRYCGELEENDPWIEWLNNDYEFFRKHSASLGQKRIGNLLDVVSFEKLDLEDSKLLLCVLIQNSFTLNTENIITTVKLFYQEGKLTSEAITISNILLVPEQVVKEYLIGEYSIETVFPLLTTENKDESLEAIEVVLNSKLKVEDKKKFLRGQSQRRENALDVDKDKALLLFESYIVTPNWQNAYHLYEICGDNKELFIDYVSHYFNTLSSSCPAESNENEISVFDRLFGDNDSLNETAYESLLDAFNYVCNGNYYLKDLSRNRIEILLRKGKLPFNEANLDQMNQSNALVDYLLYHKKAFIESIDWEYNLTSNITSELLQKGSFNVANRKLILSKAGYDVIVESSYLSEIALESFDDILTELTLSIEQVVALMNKSQDVHTNIIIADYLLNAQSTDIFEVQSVLRAIGDESFELLADRERQPRITKDDSTKKLLATLRNKGFISSYSEKDKFYRPNYHKSR